MPEACPWYVLYARPNHEAMVSKFLSLKGITNYLPTYEHRGRRGVIFRRPLFPRYLFIRFDYNDRAAVLSVPGLPAEGAILKFNSIPATLTDLEMDRVREIEAIGQSIPGDIRDVLQFNDPVEISVGRAKIAGKVLRFKSAHSVVVRVSQFGRTGEMTVEDARVRKVAA